MTMTMQAMYGSTLGNGAGRQHQQGDDNNDSDKEADSSVEYGRTPTTTTTHSALRLQTSMARKVSPFDTNEGEFKQMDAESPETSTARAHRNGATSAPLMFSPPPHALPMELVLLQTYNDSDHLPEHHEWTQDQDYWYYVTKAHGVRRRKLKKVSSWWLDLSSLGGALLSAGSSSSHEPIATGPIYNMGRAPGSHTTSTTPHPSSPLSSELALASPSTITTAESSKRTHAAKESISSMTSQETVSANSAAFKRQSSPRNSTSLMGKYYYYLFVVLL
ncbi:hypothetical protein BGX24_008569 [Mortierella sp. AD032]|nr:hypothetical protein BGX24_008569 [Mortierella sp. AD032]